MGDTLMTVIAIGLAAILMFVFPLMTMADRTDDIAQLSVATITTEFVDDIRSTGKITLDKYSKFVEQIYATGNAYDVEIEVKILDENPGKKLTIANASKIGENVYYSKYTSQILNELDKNGRMSLKEGDIVSVSVKNTNTTLAQQLKNFFYTVTGNDVYAIAAEHAGMVTATGN